ncbi:MAG: hypothetical protein DRJ50_13940 [Actinobacteria bacterium]|nr:MAG: hypothetical protein DRJ50_13940 [Actinomycetota bacterium]
MAVGEIVSFVNTPAGVQRDTVVVSNPSFDVAGSDDEDVEDYRHRVFDRFQKQPRGGAYADYEFWGEVVGGIVRIYPYTGNPGEVDVYSEAKTEPSNPNGIPSAQQLIEVEQAIMYDETGAQVNRPAGSKINSLAITRTGFTVVVTTLVDDSDIGQTKIRIEDALESVFANAGPYIQGLTPEPRRDKIYNATVLSTVYDVVSSVSGSFATVTFYDTLGGVQDLSQYDLGHGEKARLDSVEFPP